MSTPHNEAQVSDIAKTVIMPGDPLRSKFIAENFLTDAKLVNNVRGIQGYTGTYNGKRVTVMASGMGNPTIGIYSYELFKFYDVDTIIRVGSIGSLSEKADLRDIIIADQSFSRTNYDEFFAKNGEGFIPASADMVETAKECALKLGLNAHVGPVLSSDTFYTDVDQIALGKKHGLLGVEMETAALYLNALKFNKSAIAVCTVSDSLINHKEMSSEERQLGFSNMIKLALEMVK